jgi:hypothetical protein
MNRRKKRSLKINKNSNPPFSWLLIFFVVICVEIVVLSQERAWSQNYQLSIDNLRDQANVLSSLNVNYYSYITNFYNNALEIKSLSKNNTSSIFITEAERYILKQKSTKISLR